MNNTLEEKKACLWHVAFSVVYLEGLTCVFEKNYFGISFIWRYTSFCTWIPHCCS